MRISGVSYVYAVIMLLMLFIIGWSLLVTEHFESKVLPILVSGAVFPLAAIGFWREVKAGAKAGVAATKGETDRSQATEERWQGYLLNSAWIVGFALGIHLLGFLIAITLFILTYMKWSGIRWPVALIFAAATPAVIYSLFELALGIDLYKGLLLTWLG